MLQRKDYILKLIVEHFIKTAQPVASKTLIEVYGLTFSSATIRNEMQALEEEGLLEKTHTSSGRIPSEKGYHYYVETIMKERKNVEYSFPMIDEIFKRHDLSKEQAINESMSLVSQLTNINGLV